MWKDSETAVDYLNFDYIINTVIKIVLDDELSPSSIGLYGDWGSGKSSLMRMVDERLKNMNDDSILTVRFNGWLFEGYEDAKTALCGTILEKIHDERGVSDKIKDNVKKLWDKVDVQKLLSKGIKYGLDYALTGGMLSLTDITVSQITNALKKKAEGISEEQITEALNSLKTDNSIRKEIKNFHKDFEEILKETKIKHLVIFIDELDRCSPETILDVIEAMRLFLFAKGTSFVIGADQRLIEYAIKTKYKDVIGNNLDIGKEYMEKVIQYPVNIPPLSTTEVEQYISCLLLEKKLNKTEFESVLEIICSLKPMEKFNYALLAQNNSVIADQCKDLLDLSQQISSVLARQINGNPRQCKRFLNTLFMRLDMAESRHVKLKRNIMAKLMLLEYFFPVLYQLVVDSKNKDELVKFEEGKGDTGIFKDYCNDEWLKAWNEIQGKVSDENIGDYYYFSNSRLTYNQSALSKLTPDGQICLDKLMSKTDSNRNEAERMLNDLSLMDRKQIANTIFEQMKSEEELDKELLKSYVLVISYKDMVTEALTQIQSISAKRYSNAQIVEMQKFTKVLSPEELNVMKTYFGERFDQTSKTVSGLRRKKN